MAALLAIRIRPGIHPAAAYLNRPFIVATLLLYMLLTRTVKMWLLKKEWISPSAPSSGAF